MRWANHFGDWTANWSVPRVQLTGILGRGTSDGQHMTEDPLPPARDARAHRPEDAAGAWEDALCRLEDTLLAQAWDRALPDLADLLEHARVPLSVVEHDERARKLLGEAMLGRPAGEGGPVRRARQRVEFLTLEVQVLSERLRDPQVPSDEARRAVDRIDEVNQQLRRLTEGP